jgi:hypothetical protein
VTVAWLTADPGDHIRVLTQTTPVPEPETWLLLTAGLMALGWRGRRRSGHPARR